MKEKAQKEKEDEEAQKEKDEEEEGKAGEEKEKAEVRYGGDFAVVLASREMDKKEVKLPPADWVSEGGY